MIPLYDISYNLEREAAERIAAASSPDKMIRDLHFAFADRHADKALSAREARCEPRNAC